MCMHVRFAGFVCLCKEKEESSREEAKKNIYKPYQEFDSFEKLRDSSDGGGNKGEM